MCKIYIIVILNIAQKPLSKRRRSARAKRDPLEGSAMDATRKLNHGKCVSFGDIASIVALDQRQGYTKYEQRLSSVLSVPDLEELQISSTPSEPKHQSKNMFFPKSNSNTDRTAQVSVENAMSK